MPRPIAPARDCDGRRTPARLALKTGRHASVIGPENADEMRGRVTSLFMLNNGLVPAFSSGAGAFASDIAPPLTVTLLGALITVIGVAALIRLRDLRRF